MVISVNDLKQHLENTISDKQYKIKYCFDHEWFDDLTGVFTEDTKVIDLNQCIIDYDKQTVKVYIEKPLTPITLQEVVKECDSHNALCEGCPFYKLRGMQCVFYTKFPCQWEYSLKECGYKLEV